MQGEGNVPTKRLNAYNYSELLWWSEFVINRDNFPTLFFQFPKNMNSEYFFSYFVRLVRKICYLDETLNKKVIIVKLPYYAVFILLIRVNSRYE